MRKIFSFLMVLFFLISCATLPIEGKEGSDAVDEPIPYGENEFSPGLKKLRRAEILLLGSLPLFYMFTSLGYDILITDQPDSKTLLSQKITISLSLSGLLSVTDFMLGEFNTKGKTPNAGN